MNADFVADSYADLAGQNWPSYWDAIFMLGHGEIERSFRSDTYRDCTFLYEGKLYFFRESLLESPEDGWNIWEMQAIQ